MASVFANPQAHGGSFRADNLQMSIGGIDLTGQLVQSIQFQFQQTLSMLYEIGGFSPMQSLVYYVGGRARGSAGLSRILGPAQSACSFLEGFGDVCSPKNITFNAKAGCESGSGSEYLLKSAILTSVGGSVNANDVVINESLQLEFLDLDCG
jgi:hypothetical protein